VWREVETMAAIRKAGFGLPLLRRGERLLLLDLTRRLPGRADRRRELDHLEYQATRGCLR
jgi:hypothetical protein